MFIEEYKYAINERKTPECITDDVKICSDEEISDQESFNKEQVWWRKL